MENIEYFAVDIEQTTWQASQQPLSEIRRRVFIDEQGVDASEEFDTADAGAVHWLAFTPDNTAVGCARLIDDRIGRMAVLKPFRNRGIGSALMRHIINYAAGIGLPRLRLHAQIQALPFYEGMRFVASGDEFMEAGIPHRSMTLELGRFLQPRVEPSLPDTAQENRERLMLDNAIAFNEQAKKLVDNAQRQIRIFSRKLDPRIYDDDTLRDLMFELARAHPHAEIKILVEQTYPLVQDSHRLLHLYHRLPSRIEIRKLGKAIKSLHSDFLVADQSGILYNQSGDRYAGYAIAHAPLQAVELIDAFEDMWERSEPDPELRNLPL